MASGDHFFSQKFAQIYPQPPGGSILYTQETQNATALLYLPGTASRTDGAARANQINILGVGEFFAPRNSVLREIPTNCAVLNESLARQLNAKIGDEIVLRISTAPGPSRELSVVPRNQASLAFRRRVHAIALASEMGDFSLKAGQVPPPNAFLRLDDICKQSKLEDKANLLLLGSVKAWDLDKYTRSLSASALVRWFTQLLSKMRALLH